MSNWRVEYEINGEVYDALVPDGTEPNVPGQPRYVGYDELAFEDILAQEHPGVSMDDVEVTFSIQEDHPLADFFG